MPHVAQTLRDCLTGGPAERFFWDRAAHVCVNHLEHGTALGGRLKELAGRSVIIATSTQLTAALTLIELDGVARRLTILPPDTAADHLAPLVDRAEADAVVIDEGTAANPALDLPVRVICTPSIKAAACDDCAARRNGMAVADVRYFGRAETGRAHAGDADCSGQGW